MENWFCRAALLDRLKVIPTMKMQKLKHGLLGLLLTLGLGANAAAPDFSDLDSLDKVERLYREGKLERLYLFPLDLGGQDIPQNIVYVPVGFAQIKSQLDGTVKKMLQDGSVSRYSASPEYKGRSFVPSKIIIKAWHPEKTGSFSPTIEVW